MNARHPERGGAILAGQVWITLPCEQLLCYLEFFGHDGVPSMGVVVVLCRALSIGGDARMVVVDLGTSPSMALSFHCVTKATEGHPGP